jgi:hypothetical protein
LPSSHEQEGMSGSGQDHLTTTPQHMVEGRSTTSQTFNAHARPFLPKCQTKATQVNELDLHPQLQKGGVPAVANRVEIEKHLFALQLGYRELGQKQ